MAKEVKSIKDGKKDALDQALLQIEKQYGKGTIMKLGDRVNQPIDVIPTGCHLVLAVFQEEELLKFMDLNHQVKQLFLFILLQRRKSLAEHVHL